MKKVKHLAIRLSQPMTVHKPNPLVIEAHNAIVRERGECAFGKFGAQISRGTKDLIDGQIDEFHPTYLYVILRRGSDVTAFRAKIGRLISHIGRDDFSQISFPPYYKERPASAIIISEELQETKIDDLIVASSGRTLLEVILSTRTPLMLVSLSENNASAGDSYE